MTDSTDYDQRRRGLKKVAISKLQFSDRQLQISSRRAMDAQNFSYAHKLPPTFSATNFVFLDNNFPTG